MDKGAKAWQEVLEELDSETAFWAQFRLPSVKQAMHFAPWEGEKADRAATEQSAEGNQ